MSTENPVLLVSIANAELTESLLAITGDMYQTDCVNGLQQTIAKVVSQQPSVCVIDFETAHSDPDSLELIQDEKTDIVFILLCPREKSDELLASHLNQEVFRVLFTPLATGQTKLAIAAAYKQSVEQHTKPQQENRTTPKRAPRKPFNPMPLIAAVGVLAVAIGGWLFYSKNKAEKFEAAQTQLRLQEQQKAEQQNIDQLLLFAGGAKNARNYFPPKANNALDSYLKVLDKDPDNGSAQAALDELSYIALGDFDLHFSNGSADEAISSIGQARDSAASNEMFAQMVEGVIEEKRVFYLNEIRQAFSLDQISDAANGMNTFIEIFDDSDEIIELEDSILERQASMDKESEITELIASGKSALNLNRLLVPNQNNARYFINRLENVDPDNPELSTLKSELSGLLIEAISTSINNNDFIAAKRYLDAAESVGASTQSVNAQRARINVAEKALEEEQQRQLQAAEQTPVEEDDPAEADQQSEQARQEEAQRLEAERLASEEAERQAALEKAQQEQAALEQLLATPVEIPLSQLTAINRTPPVYPRRYASRGTTGSATVSFTVNKDGSTSNIEVMNTDPSNASAFGRAASTAVKSWIFEPFEDADGNVRIANSQVKISFQQ